MPLPADVGATTGSGSVWSDWGPNRHGPFANGTDLYAVTVDRGANKVRAYRSTDGGRTWTQQDAANAPAIGATTGGRCVDALAWGTDLWIANALSTSSMNLLRFSMSGNAWQTAIAGPTITLTLVSPIRLHLTRVTNTTDFFCLVYNGALETVMATGYYRVKVHQYNVTTSTWSGPYDAQGSADSPAANTLPGTQVDYYAASSVVGAGAGTHLFATTGATGALRHRIFTAGSTPAFGGAAATLGADAPTDGSVGQAAAYANGAATGVAVPYGTATAFKVARCGDSTTAATAGNWTAQTVTDRPPKRGPGTAQAGALAADGARLFAWEVTDAGQEVWWSDDGAAGAWPADAAAWKQGVDAICPGVSALPLGGGTVGVLYGDELGVPSLAQTAWDTEYTVNALATTASGYQRAQSFRYATAKTLTAVRLLVRKVGAPSLPLNCWLYGDTAGVPGTLVATSSNVSNAAQTGVAAGWLTFKFNPTALSANTTYWLRIDAGATASSTNHFVLMGSAASVYADGGRADGTSAPVWTADGAGGDLVFTLYTSEDGTERVRYDRLVTLRTSAAQAAGTTTGTAVDLGEAGPNDATVLLSVGDTGDPAGTVEVVVEHSDDGAAWAEATRGRCEGAAVRDVVALTGVGRYLRLVSTVTGADAPDVGTVAV
jgi:hypothetical protein